VKSGYFSPEKKGLSSIGWCRKKNHPLENLAKFGYKLNREYEYLINLYIHGYALKTKYRNLVISTIFPFLTSGDRKP
jgi:hypothetical protein